jgi:hypothetical protein
MVEFDSESDWESCEEDVKKSTGRKSRSDSESAT